MIKIQLAFIFRRRGLLTLHAVLVDGPYAGFASSSWQYAKRGTKLDMTAKKPLIRRRMTHCAVLGVVFLACRATSTTGVVGPRVGGPDARRMMGISVERGRGGGVSRTSSRKKQDVEVVEVTTQAEFIAAINDNVCISLRGNIDLTTNITVADSPTGIVIPDATTGFIIDGNGFSVDGAGAMRCMYIGKNATVQINRLTITNGHTTGSNQVWSKRDCGALTRLDSHDDDPARPSFLYHLLVWF